MERTEQLMTTAEAAQYLSVAPRTLDAWRTRLEGPPYKKVGRLVRYKVSELSAWVDESAKGGRA